MIYCILLHTLIVVAAALKMKIEEPNKKTQWLTDTDVELYWSIEGANDKGLKTVDLDLFQGKGKDPELIANIGFGMTYNHGDSFWYVGSDLEDGENYFVRISSPEDPKFVKDSEYFKIKRNGSPIKKQKKQAKSGGIQTVTNFSFGILLGTFMVFAMVAA